VKKLRELYVDQQAQELAQLINGNDTNVQPMSNDLDSNYVSNPYDQGKNNVSMLC